jgi:adenylate kinase
VGDGEASAQRIVMLGPPGSGKGTQAAILAGRLGIPAVSTGEMLRQAVDAGNDLGRKVEGIMAQGDLVDDDTMAQVVRSRLARQDAQEGVILDGYPRTVGQAETLTEILDGQPDAVVAIEVPEPVLVERALGRQRADDTEEVIRERLRVYRKKTEPLIGYYRDRELLRPVDGDQAIDEVTSSILEALEG